MSEDLVHVVDDDDSVRDSICFLLSSVGIVAVGYEGPLALLDVVTPAMKGCIVTDVRMPDMSGVQMIEALRARGVPTPVIVMTGHADVPLAVEAMKVGAEDFLEKPFPDDTLIRAVERALASGRARQDAAAEKAAAVALVSRLTSREQEVLAAIVDGHSNKVIAAMMGISPRTVEVHRAHLFEKLEAASVSDLVKLKIRAEV
jgi:two-component system response regulator FixJ